MIIRREIGEKGQVVIPKDIRNYLGLNIGANIIFEIKGKEIVIKKEEEPDMIVEDFFNTPKIKEKVTVKELKKVYGEQYGKEVH
jgi:AbrB family looped-hinge helix DNA binding protein